jgi:ABC-type bacteriocin/lantibiotic exporter with double-glycine peptidase domain
MILDFHGRYVPLEELRARAGISRDCASARDLLRVGRELGLAGRALRAELADFPRLGFPLIAHVRFIHFVLVEGVEDGLVHLNDPAAGRHARPVEEFDQLFTGVVLTFTPTAEFVRGGAPPPLLPGLARALRPAAGLALAAASCAALQAAPALAAALAVERLDDGHGLRALPLAAAGVACLALALLREACLARLARRLGPLHTKALVERLLRLPFAFFTYRLPGDLARIVRWPTRLADLFTAAPGRAALDGLALPLLLLGLARLDLAAALGVLGVATSHVLAARTLLRSRSRRFRARLAWAGRALAHSPEHVERCKLGGLDDELVTEVADPHARAVSVGQEDAGRQALAAAAPGLAVALAVVVALGAGGLAAVDGRLGPGGLLALLFLTATVMVRAAALARDEGELDLAADAAAALTEVGDMPPEPRPALASEEERPRGPLRLVDVSFGYAVHKPPRVAGVSLEVGPGEAVGLTGPSGGGKSTIAALLVGLHRPWSGRAELGGRPLDELPREVLAREVAWVHRAPVLFAGTLRENLTLFDPSVSDAALEAAVRDACLDEVIAARGGGLDALVESRGLALSAGERQRVELARALVRDPRVLVLDEALEALQPELEARVRARLRRRGLGLVVVSHRASTLAACDRVLEVRDGRLRPTGEPSAPASPGRALGALGPFHGGHTPGPARPEPRGGAALRAALGMVAGRCVPAVPGAEADEPLRAKARSARLRVRRVRLSQGAWWRHDGGDLLAFARDDAPRALLRRGDGYVIVDPRDPDRGEPLTPERAAALEPEAYVVHRRALDGPMRALALLRVGLPRARRDVVAWAALTAGAGLSLAGLPLAAAAVVRQALPWGDVALVLTLTVGAGWVAVVAALLEAAGVLARRRAEGRLEHEAVVTAADRLVRMPPRALRRLAPGEIARRWSGLGEALEGLWDRVTPGLTAFVVAGGGLAGLALLSPSLALVTLALWLLLPLAAVAVAARALPIEALRVERAREARLFLLDLLQGMARLRSAAADARVAARWEALLSRELDARARARWLEGVHHALEDAHPTLALLGLLAASAAGVGPHGPAALVAAALALLLGAPAAAAAARGARAALLARQALQRFAPLVEAPVEPLAGHDPGRLRGALELRDVTLRHPGAPAPALDGASLRVEPGRIVALVGRSGAGKTTTLRLLAGLEEPDAGEVLVDDRPLREHDVAAVRAQVGTVLQDDQLIVSTLRHNVAGSAPAGLDELWAALREAGLERDVQAMPMGVQTILEDDRVSSGEKQRLLLAARLLRAPRVLLLDETTSAVDEAAEVELFRALRARGITCVVAAHRRSAIELADEVHVLEGGRIVESGPPAVLLAREGALTHLLAAPRELELSA